jgi:excisionase family DNA binding protein
VPESLALSVVVPPEQFEALARRVADVLAERRDDGFLDSDAAAEYLGISRKAVYALVERGRLPHHRPAGRLLFDRRELRAWVQRS